MDCWYLRSVSMFLIQSFESDFPEGPVTWSREGRAKWDNWKCSALLHVICLSICSLHSDTLTSPQEVKLATANNRLALSRLGDRQAHLACHSMLDTQTHTQGDALSQLRAGRFLQCPNLLFFTPWEPFASLLSFHIGVRWLELEALLSASC